MAYHTGFCAEVPVNGFTQPDKPVGPIRRHGLERSIPVLGAEPRGSVRKGCEIAGISKAIDGARGVEA